MFVINDAGSGGNIDGGNGSSGQARHEAWWNNVLDNADPLRQRVAFALSEIFVVSDLDYLLANNQ